MGGGEVQGGGVKALSSAFERAAEADSAAAEPTEEQRRRAATHAASLRKSLSLGNKKTPALHGSFTDELASVLKRSKSSGAALKHDADADSPSADDSAQPEPQNSSTSIPAKTESDSPQPDPRRLSSAAKTKKFQFKVDVSEETQAPGVVAEVPNSISGATATLLWPPASDSDGDAAANTFVPQPRYFHSAVYIPSHPAVLFIGGSAVDSLIGEIAVLDLNEYQWHEVVPRVFPRAQSTSRGGESVKTMRLDENFQVESRAGHKSVYVNGEVLSLGGVIEKQYCNFFDNFMLGANVWSTYFIGDKNEEVPEARCDHSLSLVPLQDGAHALVLFGGWNLTDCFNDLHTLRIEPDKMKPQGAWRRCLAEKEKTAPCRRRGHSAAVYSDDVSSRIYLFGGLAGFSSFLGDFWEVEIGTNGTAENWSLIEGTGSVPGPRAYHNSCVIGPYVVISGGILPEDKKEDDGIFYVFDCRDQTWTKHCAAGPAAGALQRYGAVMLARQGTPSLLICGGAAQRTEAEQSTAGGLSPELALFNDVVQVDLV